jgi:hypothetical protein
MLQDLLVKLGLSKRKARPVGNELETGRTEEEPSAQVNAIVKGVILLLLVGATVAAFPRGEVYEYTVQVGDTWRQPTLVAPFTFPIYKDAERVAQEREAARENTRPIFQEVPDAAQRMAANRDTLRRQIDRTLEAYAAMRYHQSRDQAERAQEDSLRYLKLRRSALVTLPPGQWRDLGESYVEQQAGLSSTARGRVTQRQGTADRADTEGPRVDEALLEAAFEVGANLLEVGVMSRARDSVSTEEIIVRNEEERTLRTVSKDNLYGLNEAYEAAQEQMRERFADRPELANIGVAFFRAIFQPSLRYMRVETMQKRQQNAQSISEIVGGVEQGQKIVSKGEQVTDNIKRMLTSLERERNQRASQSRLWAQIPGQLLFTVLCYLIFYLYVFFLRREIFDNNRYMLLIALLFGLIVGAYAYIVRVPWISLYAVPVAITSVLFTIIFDTRVALMGTLALASLGGAMVGLDLEYTLATYFAGTLGVFSVRDIKNRGQFFVSPVVIFIGYVAVLSASFLYLGSPTEQFWNEVKFAAIGASLATTSYVFLWVFERGFDITTDLTLLELSDTNNKLLKELSLRAPGSFNHSLQVANLAEAAADRIGANALLTRVGALYHDIGKMTKPEYFVENQRAGNNPHDRLKPRMSALIIASHVKEGLERGKKENLPERVLEFIPTHHGTARIEYFYQKAVGENEEDDPPVLESEFRYPGPRPHTKETGILMLADSVEAASRSLEEPTHKRLKSIVDLIFQERIDDGQLDNTDLTFRDLSRIKDTFLSMLMGIYHVRIKYPEQQEEADEEEGVVISKTDTEHGLPPDLSVVKERGVWGTPEQSVSAERIEKLPGVSRRREPSPRLAEASPYQASNAPVDGDGAPPEVPIDAGGNGAQRLTSPSADDGSSADKKSEGNGTPEDEPGDSAASHDAAPDEQEDKP